MVIKYLNVIFGEKEGSETFWNQELKTLVQKKFESAFSPEELSEKFNLKKKVAESVALPSIFLFLVFV